VYHSRSLPLRDRGRATIAKLSAGTGFASDLRTENGSVKRGPEHIRFDRPRDANHDEEETMNTKWLSTVALAGTIVLVAATAPTTRAENPCPTGEIYVTSQGLCYETFATRDPLTMHGRFQLLEDGVTEFGPRDAGYLGGRWWEDLNGNGMQDEGDHFFLCPLMGPGHSPTS
jgi:hypothetical protein